MRKIFSMILEENNYKEVIDSYNQEDWQPLLDLIPRVESTPKFDVSGPLEIDDSGAIQIPHVKEVPVIEEFRKVVYEIPIMINFDWCSWDEGRSMARDETFNYDSVDIPTKCKLITAIVRNDRFCEGALSDAFESGLILKILKSIQKQVDRV